MGATVLTAKAAPTPKQYMEAQDSQFRNLRDELELENTVDPPNTKPSIFGHRGSLHDVVENTLESFEVCYECGCQGVELDVFLLKDGSLVAFHGSGTDTEPGSLPDYCQVDGQITDLTLNEARKLTFVKSDMVPAASLKAKIPTLEEVLEKFQGTNFKMKIELKGKGTVLPTLEVVERLGMQEQCAYSSFYHERLAELRKLRPDKKLYPTATLFKGTVPHDFIQRTRDVGATEIHLRYDTCTTSRVRAIHRAGFRSMAWFRGPKAMKEAVPSFEDVVSEKHLYEIVAKTGVQQLCVNRPRLAMEIVKSLPFAGAAVRCN